MKRFIAIAAGLFLLSTSIMAQDKHEEAYQKAMKDYKPRIGIKAGLNIANMTLDNAGTINDKKAVPGWNAGIYCDLPLLPILSIQPGIMLSSKGSKFTVGDAESNNYTQVSSHPLYLEIPVNAVVKIPLPGKVKLFVGAGPYAAMGIGGKNKLEGKLLGVSFSDNTSITYSSENNSSSYNSDLKRFDAGINLLAGLEISHFTLNANYGYGMVNIKSGSNNNDSKYQNRVVGISIGLLF